MTVSEIIEKYLLENCFDGLVYENAMDITKLGIRQRAFMLEPVVKHSGEG